MERDYFARLQKWAESGEYTDLVLSCAEHNFRVHQVIVCAHSQFFQVACSGGFKESSTKIIELHDDLPSVRRMVSYMYTFDYDDHDSEHDRDSDEVTEDTSTIEKHDKPDVVTTEGDSQDDSELFSSVRMYAIAEKYGMSGLKTLTLSRFASWVEEHWNSVYYPLMADEAFSSVPPDDVGLKEVIADSIVQHISLLDRPEWQAVIWDNSYLCRRILDQVATLLVNMKIQTETEERDYRTQMLQLEGEKNTLSARLSSVMETVNRTTACRHCSVKFETILEAPNATLRCRDCRTRHY